MIITTETRDEWLEKVKSSPSLAKEIVRLEMPLGEIATSMMGLLLQPYKDRIKIDSLTGKEGFNAQGLEGKCFIDLTFGQAIVLMKLVNEYRGRILLPRK